MLRENHVFFADSLVGHRSFDQFRAISGQLYTKDRVNHNSHVLVIRKRHDRRAAAAVQITRFVVKSWGAPPKSLGRCGSARAQSIFLPSITLGCKNLKHTTQGHSKHG